MYADTLTVFNLHDGLWYPSVIERANLLMNRGATSTPSVGTVNADSVEIIIHCSVDKTIETQSGPKICLGPKAYASCTDPADYITFRPEMDFVLNGAWPDTDPIRDDAYAHGFYDAMNTENDGVYKVTSVAFYGLLPHFEIGGE